MIISGIEINNEPGPYSGTITQVNDTEVTIRITGRMGIMKLPLRAVLGINNPEVGDKVRFMMSFIEIENNEERIGEEL